MDIIVKIFFVIKSKKNIDTKSYNVRNDKLQFLKNERDLGIKNMLLLRILLLRAY